MKEGTKAFWTRFTVVMFVIFIVVYGVFKLDEIDNDREIPVSWYESIHEWGQEHPEVKLKIENSLYDGEVSRKEYWAISEVNEEAQKAKIKEEYSEE